MSEKEVRPIDANALLKDISKSVVFTTKGTFNAEIRGAYKIIDRIKVAPTIDPESLRPQGKWNRYKENCLHNNCSVCGYENCREDNFCPNCGAKMDKEGEV